MSLVYIVKAAENKKGKIVEPKKEVESKYHSKQSMMRSFMSVLLLGSAFLQGNGRIQSVSIDIFSNPS